ncbi:unnamed protein product [Discula destructiva]
MIIGYRYARRKLQEREARRQPVELPSQQPDDNTTPSRAADTAETVDARSAVGEATSSSNPSTHQSRKASAPSTAWPHSKSTSAAPEMKAPTLEEEAEQRRRRSYRWKVVLGLFAPFTLQALDTTIVAAALPTIAAEFDRVSEQNWIISVFNLTAATFLPFWAQATDIFGRHITVQLTIIIMMIGSAICTGAPTSAFPALLIGRALQGVGAAGINISVRTILADKVSLADYALNWTLFAMFAAVGYTIGPVVGGYLTETSWRWCFAINLPVAALSIVLVVVLLRKELLGPQPLPELAEQGDSRRGRLLVRLSTIDYVGQVLFFFGLGLLILAFTWAGNGEGGTYKWASVQVLTPLVVGAALTVCWFWYEYSMSPGRAMSRVFPRQRAMMPWVLFQNKEISILFLVNFCLGVCLYSIMYFMDFYFQYVQGQSASNAGTALLYFLPGLGVGSYSAMFLVNVFPRQTIYPLLLGSLASAVGIQVLCWAIDVGNLSLIYGMMALAGFGVGVRMSPGSMHGLAFFPASTASITCVFAFAMPFGGAVGLTLMSTVFNSKLGPDHANAKIAIMYAYYAIVPFMWLCVLACLVLGNVWVNKNGDHEVVHGAYILSVFTRTKLAREKMTRGGGDWENARAHPDAEVGV